jgi:peroxiredoxin
MTTKPMAEALQDVFVECRDMDAALSERLTAFADAVRRLNPSFQDAVDRLIARLTKSQVGQSAPAPGDPMPPFMLPDETGKLVSLHALLEKGPVAVTFHRGHWCPYCRINTSALAEVQDQIAADGGQIVAITPDKQEFTIEWKSESDAHFPILTDIDNGYALSLNIIFWVGEEMKRMIEEAGYNVSKSQGNDSWFMPVPATFVIGTDGTVKARYVDPDYRRRMAIQELVESLRDAR